MAHQTNMQPASTASECVSCNAVTASVFFSLLNMGGSRSGCQLWQPLSYVLLEANSCGQWSWIQVATELPICETLVDFLTGMPSDSEKSYARA